MTEQNKNIVIIIPHDQFRDEEYVEVRKALDEAGFGIVVASSHSSTAHGRFGTKVDPDITVSKIHLDDYIALVFIGGPGVDEYFDDHEVLSLVRAAFQKKVLLGAICSAPVIFANAGILANKKVTVFETRREIISQSGAFLTERGVEQDGEIITAAGPEDAVHFGKAIAKALSWRKEHKGYLV